METTQSLKSEQEKIGKGLGLERIQGVLTNCEPASHASRASESCESCESSCEPCETEVRRKENPFFGES